MGITTFLNLLCYFDTYLNCQVSFGMVNHLCFNYSRSVAIILVIYCTNKVYLGLKDDKHDYSFLIMVMNQYLRISHNLGLKNKILKSVINFFQ